MSLPEQLSVALVGDRGTRRITREVRDLTVRDVVSGGHASCVAPLHRPLAVQPDEIRYYGRMVVTDDRNGTVVSDTRLEDPARSAGPDGQIWELTGIGWSAHASDRHVPLVYADKDYTRWVPTNRSAQLRLSSDLDASDEPGLLMQFDTGSSLTVAIHGGYQYRTVREVGQKLARVSVRYDMGVAGSGAKLRMDLFSSATNAMRVDWVTTPTSASRVVATDWTLGDDVVQLKFERATGPVTAGAADWIRLDRIAVRTVLVDTSGTEITTGYTADTVLAHEVVRDLLGRLLPHYDGSSIVDTATHPIDQLAYPTGVTPRQVLDDLMLLEPGHYWAVWERLDSGLYRFEWTEWPTQVRYDADVVDGYSSTGSGDGLYNAVRVYWRDVDGQPRQTQRTSAVADLTAAGLTREAPLHLGDEVGSLANAQRAGDQFLAEHAAAPNAGRLTIARPILDRIAGRYVMPWEIRPGNLIRVRGVLPRGDALNATVRDGVTVFRVVSRTYSASRAVAELELDTYALSTAQALAALQRQRVRR